MHLLLSHQRYAECVAQTEENIPNWDQVEARELYDYSVDQWESRNVANDPEYGAVVKQLSQKLRAGWADALPKAE